MVTTEAWDTGVIRNSTLHWLLCDSAGFPTWTSLIRPVS